MAVSARRLLPHGAAFLLALLAAGCGTIRADRAAARAHYDGRLLKPVVAIPAFESLANPPGRWDLRNGMADLLGVELRECGRVTILERKDLGETLGRLVRQARELARRDAAAPRGRAKEAQYILRGRVTDFSESAGPKILGIFGGGIRARVAFGVQVADARTGETVADTETECEVPAGSGPMSYEEVAFGGEAFFETPLGKATAISVRRIARDILRRLPVETWSPRVAESGSDFVIINGGENMRVRRGAIFRVREPAREVTDPVTGNVIDLLPGRIIGQIKITKVTPESAHGILLDGAARRGDWLER